jgi:hypothetical protein
MVPAQIVAEGADPLAGWKVGARGVMLASLFWSGLLVVHEWFLGSGTIGRWADSAGWMPRVALFLGMGLLIGLLDRIWQSRGVVELLLGGVAGVLSWAVGGTILYSFVIPVVDGFLGRGLTWNTDLFGQSAAGWVFSGISVVAGLVSGLLLGYLQTRTSTGQSWRRSRWWLVSMLAGTIGWALVPMGVISV